jgi:hypothetical protein
VNYSFKVFAGSYDIYVESGEDYDQNVLPDGQRTRLLKGCSN